MPECRKCGYESEDKDEFIQIGEEWICLECFNEDESETIEA